MNTSIGAAILLEENVDHFYSNSFMYFLAENGIPGLIYIIGLFSYMIYKVLKNSKLNRNDPTIFKIALLVFVFISQIAGEYFTDPFLWCLYGLICADNVDKNEFYVFQYNKKRKLNV